MEKHTLKIYESTVEIYEFKKDEALRAEINIKGEVQHPVVILENGNYITGSRKLESYYARGFADDKDIYILADNINTKQLANIFLMLEAHSALAAVYDLENVSISKMHEDEIIYDDTVISSGTIDGGTVHEAFGHAELPEEEPKHKKKRRR